ncbi:tape measure protein [Acidovorax lacteus]|uniref:Tape measure protein N-terminal domain-containing protein n=1 Tax=Acidovorax lacteus TaxID=1924988 RepID=A0ABP8L1Q2_9BURK
MTQDIGIKIRLDGAAQVQQEARGVGASLQGIGAAASTLRGAMTGLAGAFAGAVSVREFFAAADSVTRLQNSLQLATGSARAAAQAYNELYNIAQRSRVSFTELGGTFASISSAAASLGVSQQRLLTVTEAIGNAVTISGASAQASQAALVQLSQGLASGTLRGEELNSILEQTPRLAQALADGLGVARGELRKLGEQGAITADQVVRALESQAGVLAGEIKNSTLTVGQAFTQLQNAAVRTVGDFDKATGASAALASTIGAVAGAVESLGDTIRANETAFKVLAGGLAGAATVAGLGALASGLAAVKAALAGAGAVLVANPALLALLGIGAAVGAGVAYVSASARSAEGIERAIAALRAENERSEAAMARATAAGRTAGADNIAKTIEARRDQIAKLRAELDQLNVAGRKNDPNGIGGGRGTVNPDTVGAMALKQAAAERELMDIRMRLAGVNKQYFDDLTKLEAQFKSGALSQAEYVRLVSDLANKTYKEDKSKEAAAGVDQLGQSYAQLVERIKERISAQEIENAQGDKLTESQRIRLQLDRDVATGKIREADAQSAKTRALLEQLEAQEKIKADREREIEENKRLVAVYNETVKAQEAMLESRQRAAASVEDQVRKMQDEAVAAEIAAQQNVSLAVALEQVSLARLKEQQSQLLAQNADAQTLLAVQREIEAREQLIGLIGAADARKANKDAADAAAAEWKRTADSIEQSLTDALLRGFESGKGFARNLRDTIANMFKTLVLRPIISAIVSPVAMGLTGLLGFSGPAAAASAASAGGGILGSAGGILSGVGALAGNFGAGLATGFSGLMAGNLGSTLSLGTGLISSGATAGGIGTIVGALGPIMLGVTALLSIARATRGESRSGGQYAYVFDDGVLTNNRRGTSSITDQRGAVYLEGAGFGAGKYDDDAVKQAINGTVGSINALFKGLGSSLSLTAFQAGFETSGKGRGGVFAGGTLSDGQTFGESGKGDNYAGTLFEQTSTQSPDMKTALENFSLDLKQATIQALQKAGDIPQSIKDKIGKVDAEALTNEAADALLLAINEQIQGVQKLRGAFDAMNLGDLADIAFDTAAALAQAAGGFDKLLGNLDRFYQNFYTDEERRANLQRQVDKEFDRLGIAKPQGREGFRTLVEDTLRRADEQQAGRQQLVAALIKDPSSLISGGGQANFDRLAGYGGLNAEFLGNAAADPARREALSAFMSDLGDVFRAGKTQAEIEASVSDLVRANSAVLGMGEDVAATAAALLNVSDAFAELNESAEQVAQRQRAERDKALQALQRAVAEERDVLRARIDAARETVENLRGIFDLLATSIKELRAEAIGPAANATIGQAFITQALATARATGYLPERERLADAIGAARGGLGLENFASVAEQRFAQLRLAGELEALQQLAGEQLSDAERLQRTAEAQLEALEETLKYWEKQVRIANEGVEATLSVKDAILALTGKMFPETAGEATGSGSGSGSGGFVIGGGGGAGNPSKPGSGFFGAGGTEINDPTAVARFTSIRDFTRTLDFGDGNKGASVGALAQAANAYGVDYREIAIANGYRPEDVARLFEEYGYTVPKFAVGTNYVPHDMLAMVHKGEAIVPAPYNPAANPGMAGNSSEQRATREEITALRRQMDQLIFEMRRTANATNGNPEAPTLVKLA